MTKILVLGANGQVARHTTPCLLRHSDVLLTLYLRRATRLPNPDPTRVTIVEGDVLDGATLRSAMQGQDVVYANLAGRMAEQADAIVDAMHAVDVRRLIFISAMGIYGEVPGERYRSVLDPYRDSAAVIEQSDLDYTILRPGWFTHEEKIDYRVTPKGQPFQGHDISLNGLADFITKLATTPGLYKSVESRRERSLTDGGGEPSRENPERSGGSRDDATKACMHTTRSPRPLNITDVARTHHDQLFPNHVSTLAVTDPELIEVFDNFAFDEVLAHTRLEPGTRLLLTLAAIIGSQAVNEYKVMVGAALNVGVTPVEIKEVLYQAVPYVGLARVYDFLHATNEALRSRGVELPLDGQSTTTPETRYAKGLAAQKAIFGTLIDDLYAASPKDQLHIQRMLSANCFGDFLTRTGLPVATREIVTLSFLIAMGGADAQVKGHMLGNLNVGNDRAVLLDVLTQLLPWVGYPRTLNALACLNEVVPAGDTDQR